MATHNLQLQTLANSLLQRMAGESAQTATVPEPSPETRQPQPAPADQIELTDKQFYQFKFDFFYEKVVQSSREARILEEDRSRTLTQDMYQRVSARFSLDLTFISSLARQTGRAAAIDSDVFETFTEAAQGLANMDEKSFRKFISAVDELFNSVETALGLSEDGLDGFADMVKAAASGFFDAVKSASARMEERQELAASDFRKQLRQMLQPEQEDRGLMRDIRRLLRESGLPDDQKKELLRLLRLIIKFARKAMKDDNRQFIEQVRSLLDRYEPAAKPAEAKPEPKAVPARVVELYERTEVTEQLRVQVQEQSLNMIAA